MTHAKQSACSLGEKLAVSIYVAFDATLRWIELAAKRLGYSVRRLRDEIRLRLLFLDSYGLWKAHLRRAAEAEIAAESLSANVLNLPPFRFGEIPPDRLN